jgi:uncharacterized protein GlcG (DUF336 family)
MRRRVDEAAISAAETRGRASILRPAIAIGKAWGAIGMGESSRRLAERLKERPAFLGALSDMSGGSGAGGRRCIDYGRATIIGAVGASGATSEEDEACAIAGIQAAGLEHKV